MPVVDRYALIRRKYDLAQRMIVLEARTATIMQWAGLSEYRVQQLARRFAPNRGTTRRGHSPHTPRYFARSPQIEAESLAFVYLAMEARVLPDRVLSNARQELPDLRRGERLIEAFEFYVALLGTVRLSLERAISLVYAFSGGEQLSLRYCSRCHDLMLTPRSAQNILCPFCRTDSALSSRIAGLPQASDA